MRHGAYPVADQSAPTGPENQSTPEPRTPTKPPRREQAGPPGALREPNGEVLEQGQDQPASPAADAATGNRGRARAARQVLEAPQQGWQSLAPCRPARLRAMSAPCPSSVEAVRSRCLGNLGPREPNRSNLARRASHANRASSSASCHVLRPRGLSSLIPRLRPELSICLGRSVYG